MAFVLFQHLGPEKVMQTSPDLALALRELELSQISRSWSHLYAAASAAPWKSGPDSLSPSREKRPRRLSVGAPGVTLEYHPFKRWSARRVFHVKLLQVLVEVFDLPPREFNLHRFHMRFSASGNAAGGCRWRGAEWDPTVAGARVGPRRGCRWRAVGVRWRCWLLWLLGKWRCLLLWILPIWSP